MSNKFIYEAPTCTPIEVTVESVVCVSTMYFHTANSTMYNENFEIKDFEW